MIFHSPPEFMAVWMNADTTQRWGALIFTVGTAMVLLSMVLHLQKSRARAK